MSVSKVSNKWLNRAYKCIAIFLVTFAVLISALRLLLPYAHNYRVDFQNYINETYGSNIVIGSLHMDWQSSGPTLVAQNVSLLQTDGAEAYIQSFNINVDFWRSLRHRRLFTEDFSLSGVKILFDRALVEQNADSSKDSELLDSVSELFLKQINRFSIQDSQIILRGAKGERTFLISQLHWLNMGNEHKAHGSVILDGLTSNNLQLQLQVTGEHLTEMQGQMYLQANQLNITPWLDTVLVIDDENTHSSVNFDAWLTIEDGLAQQLQLSLDENQVAWQHKNKISTINFGEGQVFFEGLASDKPLHIYSSPIAFRSNEQTWQPLSFNLYKDKTTLDGYISDLDIAGVIDLLPLFVDEKTSSDLLEQLNPVGKVSNIFVRYENENVQSVANFSNITSQYSDGIPGIENVQGELVFTDNNFAISLQASNGELDFAEHFPNPIPYQQLTSSVLIRLSDKGWQLTSPDIQFISDEIELTAEIGLYSEPEKDLEMSLLATAKNGNVVDANTFYPHLLMGDDLVSYLDRALVKGTLEQTVVAINGPLAQFPYENGGGTFIVDAELKDATFSFDEQWPAIKHFDANLNFTNNSMLISGRSGSLTGIDVEGVTAGIKDLSNEQVLLVDASFTNTAPDLVSHLMLTSPLDDSVGSVLEQVVISNELAGNFLLTLPLNNTDAAVTKGTIKFNNNLVNLKSPSMLFSQINGQLHFENEKINADDLTFFWRDMPMSIKVNANEKKAHYQTEIALKANWQKDKWLAQLPEKMRSYGQGMLNWHGLLRLNNYHNGGFDYQLTLDSSLTETELLLPAPFSKTVNEQVIANIEIKGDSDYSTVDAKIGEQLQFYGNLNHQLVSFSQAHLILGQENMYLPLSGFHITTELSQADLMQWQPFISNLLESIEEFSEDNSDTSPALLGQPERIRGKIAKLDFLGEAIHDVSFNLEDQISWWHLDLTSKEARTGIKFFPDWHQQGIEITADFIRLAPEKLLFTASQTTQDTTLPIVKKDTSIEQQFNDELFANMPPMRVNCEDCQYGNLNFGKVDFILERPESDLLTLSNFSAKRKNLKLGLDASWRQNKNQSMTYLKGELNSKDVERELDKLSLSSSVADSAFKTSFDLNWQGAPQNFAFASLSGAVKAKLDEGVLKEVPDKARGISILSLQSLVRKLRFDFRDMFADGMYYSEIKGDYTINNGVIHTENTKLKGTAGDAVINGSTNLVTNELDYNLTYKLNYSSSLPAIAWLATLNPVTFLAGVALDGVITSRVPYEVNYALSGTIENPSFEEIKRVSKNISVDQDGATQIVDNIPATKPDPQPNGRINPETGLIEQQIPPSEDDKSDG